jgi:hypothetical protein
VLIFGKDKRNIFAATTDVGVRRRLTKGSSLTFARSLAMKSFLDRLVQVSPIPVMVRVTLENVLAPETVDRIFVKHAVAQSQRTLLFSGVVELMLLVVCRLKPSVHAAYTHLKDSLGVSAKSLYNKLSLIEPQVSRAMVVETVQQLRLVVNELQSFEASPIPGFEVRILDGNHHPASEHRLKVLRNVAAGPLPGQSLVVFDPVRRLIVDCIPCEDGHAQERAIVTELLDPVVPGIVWIADRNFCTCTVMFELALHQAYFVIRHHAQITLHRQGPAIDCGTCDSGRMIEQQVIITDCNGKQLTCRLITIELFHPTRDGDRQIQILSNLPPSVSAPTIGASYRDRWQVENVNLELVKHFASEQKSLGYPPATLFAFCMSLVAYNVLAVVQASLRSVHGEAASPENLSSYYVAQSLASGWEATMLIEESFWVQNYSGLDAAKLAVELKGIAQHLDISKYRKHKRGPKKPPTPRTRFRNKPHVSTKRLLDQAKAKSKT